MNPPSFHHPLSPGHSSQTRFHPGKKWGALLALILLPAFPATAMDAVMPARDAIPYTTSTSQGIALETILCALLDESILTDLDLTPGQHATWRRFAQQSPLLRKDTPDAIICQPALHPAQQNMLSRHAPNPGEETWLIAWLDTLSPAQRTQLGRALQAQQTRHDDLHEKLILHHLVL